MHYTLVPGVYMQQDRLVELAKRTMSAAARRKISESIKRRHAALREGTASQPKRRPYGISAAARKKISDMMKARWAA